MYIGYSRLTGRARQQALLEQRVHWEQQAHVQIQRAHGKQQTLRYSGHTGHTRNSRHTGNSSRYSGYTGNSQHVHKGNSAADSRGTLETEGTLGTTGTLEIATVDIHVDTVGTWETADTQIQWAHWEQQAHWK